MSNLDADIRAHIDTLLGYRDAEIERLRTRLNEMDAVLTSFEHESAKKIVTMRAALERIERWFGEFPETGKTWPESGDPVSYGACYGSNGERDFMRSIARNALADPQP